MVDILDTHGVNNINAVEVMQCMTHRGTIHFQNTMNVRTIMSKVLETAIEISDAIMKLGFVRHLFDLATQHASINV